MEKQHFNQAFTLVELSIVLVILGLLIGGVLTGQSLIRAAELRSVSTQYSSYVTATQTFRDKYFALPGDMTNAQAYWGIAHATPATCATTASTTAVTCNGDGNGRIDLSAGSQEPYRFWQHLANAGLIEGSYTGVNAGVGASVANSARGKLNSSVWYAVYQGAVSGQNYLFDGQYDNILAFGGPLPGGAADPVTAILKPEEMYNIDMKLDDGKPATGKFVLRAAYSTTVTTCTDAAGGSTLTANYLLTNTAVACVAVFRQVF